MQGISKEEAASSTVEVGLGRGVYVGNGRILTAAHVVRFFGEPGWQRELLVPIGPGSNAIDPRSFDVQNAKMTCACTAYEAFEDVAVLDAISPLEQVAAAAEYLATVRPAEIEIDPPDPDELEGDGRPVCVLTHEGEWLTGVAKMETLWLDGEIRPGTSGSPVFSAETGRVLGIVTNSKSAMAGIFAPGCRGWMAITAESLPVRMLRDIYLSQGPRPVPIGPGQLARRALTRLVNRARGL